MKSTLTQLWVRLYNLPLEYWHEEVFVGIARLVGNPLKIDGMSMHGEVGHFARILIEIDMSQPLQSSVMVDREEASFFVDLSYENIPLFCSDCQMVGYSTSKCRAAKSKGDNEPAKAVVGEDTVDGKKKSDNAKSGRATKEWVVRTFGETNKAALDLLCLPLMLSQF
ncbi:hypothetical protein C2S52_006285 [Perilla frutescens var. hirtella]|nr:hypothetical protein C2S52_006285 [Perilla frutescens var. hirtella]